MFEKLWGWVAENPKKAVSTALTVGAAAAAGATAAGHELGPWFKGILAGLQALAGGQ